MALGPIFFNQISSSELLIIGHRIFFDHVPLISHNTANYLHTNKYMLGSNHCYKKKGREKNYHNFDH